MDVALILYKSMKIHHDKNLWAQIALRLAQSHIFCVEKSNELTDNFAGGVPFTSRNLNFIVEDKTNNKFKDKGELKYEKIGNWIKSIFNYYYFDSFIENNRKPNDDYSKIKFENDTIKCFKEKPEETVDYLVEISEDEKYPAIVLPLLNIQQVAKGKNKDYKFNFLEFVSNCLKVEIDKNTLKYINTQIEDTFNLIYNSSISLELMFNFCQIKIVKNIYEELLEEMDSVKSEEKGNKLNSDELLRNNALRKTLLRFRLLEKLLENKETFTKGINPILYDKNIDNIILRIKEVKNNQNQKSVKELIEFIIKNTNNIQIINKLFPFYSFKGKKSIISYLMKMIIELSLKKINFSINMDYSDFSFNFNNTQYGKVNSVLILDEKLCLKKGSKIETVEISQRNEDKKNPTGLTIIENLGEEKTIFYILLILNLIPFNDLNKKIMNETFIKLQQTFEKDSFDNFLSKNFKDSFKQFLTTNFFLERSGILARIWTFLYSLKLNSEVLSYLLSNFLAPEKTFYDIILNDFYLQINQIKDINKFLDFSNKINFFYQEDSFLWMDLIEQKIPSNQPQDYYNKQLEKINEEISNLSILKDYKSLKEQYSFFYDKLDKKKDEINKKLKYNEDEKKRKEIEK